MEAERIVREVNALVEAGYREVVLSGINLGRWGKDLGAQTSDLGPLTFASLVRTILAETSLEKLRLSSIEPMDWSDELIALVASSVRIAKHAHVPMQSGSDAVLRRMHRKYRPWHYREKIEKIRAAMPTAAIGADVMVGFPGETDAEFEATRRMIEDLPFTYLHVFTYSARPGTPAAGMAAQVPVQVVRERNRILRELAAGKKLAFMRSFVGRQIEAITLRSAGGASESPAQRLPRGSTEHSIPPNENRPSTSLRAGSGWGSPSAPAQFTEALTDNYLKLRLRGRHEANRWLRARVEEVAEGVLMGEALEF